MPKRDKVCQKILTRWKREINLVVKEGCQIWKDKYVFLFVCLLLTGCASDKTKPSAENRKNLTIDINKIQLPIEQDCSLGSYFVDGDVVYYSVYMQWEIMRKIRMQNLMFPWKQKSNLLSGEETELLKAEQDSFEWMFRRGETLCTKNGNEIYVISIE